MIKVFNKIIIFNVININICAININIYNNYSKAFNGVSIKVIIFLNYLIISLRFLINLKAF